MLCQLGTHCSRKSTDGSRQTTASHLMCSSSNSARVRISISNTCRLRACMYSNRAFGRTVFVTGSSGFSVLGVGEGAFGPSPDGLAFALIGLGREGDPGRLRKALAVGVIGVLDGLGPGSTGSEGNIRGASGEERSGKGVAEADGSFIRSAAGLMISFELSISSSSSMEGNVCENSVRLR